MAPSQAAARRVDLRPERVEKDGHPIVLAEIVAFAPVTIETAPPRQYPRKGYKLTFRVNEILRGDIGAERFQIPFSAKGYGDVWEFESEPKVGMKSLVFLESQQDGKWSDYGLPGSIVPLATYDDPEVRTLRAQLNFWAITDPIARKEAAKAGCFGDDMGFRSYCIYSLAEEMPYRNEAAGEYGTIVWEIFTDNRTTLDDVLRCDRIFWNRYRSLGWNSHAPRREILLNAVERAIVNPPSDARQSLAYLLREICNFPTHQREHLALLLRMAKGSDENLCRAAIGAMAWLYQPVPDSEEGKAVNSALLRELRQYASEKNRTLALRANSSLHSIQEQTTLLGDSAEDYVAGSWEKHLGTRIKVIGEGTYEKTPEFGIALEVNGLLLWLPDFPDWNRNHPTGKPSQAEGAISEVFDVPVFRYVPGKPFQKGLPVPEPYELKAASRRLILLDATWEFLEEMDSGK